MLGDAGCILPICFICSSQNIIVAQQSCFMMSYIQILFAPDVFMELTKLGSSDSAICMDMASGRIVM